MARIRPELQFVKEIRESYDLDEIGELLHTGNWIAISVTFDSMKGKYLFVLGRTN